MSVSVLQGVSVFLNWQAGEADKARREVARPASLISKSSRLPAILTGRLAGLG